MEDKAVSVGVAAHISAASDGGPRHDPGLTSEQRGSIANAIWLCQTCGRLIDTDEQRFPVSMLLAWKRQAEHAALSEIGRPTSLAASQLVRITRGKRFGAELDVLVGNEPIEYCPIYIGGDDDYPPTWFLQAFVVRFKVKKRDRYDYVMLDGITAIVHEWMPVPHYEVLYGIFPAESELYYVDIDKPGANLSRSFTAARFYTPTNDGMGATEHVARPQVLEDSVPAAITVRINARTPGLYTVSLEATFSNDDETESCTIMEPRRIIFEHPDDVEASVN